MAKIIDLAGTTLSYFKIGKTGPRIKNNAGEIEVRDTGDTAYGPITTSILKLFSNGLFKTQVKSDPALASDLEIILPPTKGVEESFLQATPDGVLNKVTTSFQKPKLDNISLVKQGTGEFQQAGGGVEVLFAYTPVPTASFLGATSFVGSSIEPVANTGNILLFRTRIDNGFANTGTLTAYLVQVPAVLGGTVVPIAASNPVNFNPGTYPAGSFLDVNFTWGLDAQVIAGQNYAFMVGTTAGVFMGVGTDQALSRSFVAVAPGFTSFNLAGSQNTNYMIVTVNQPGTNKLITDSQLYMGVRNLPLDYHQIDPIDVAMLDGQVAYVTINRGQTAPNILPVTVTDIATFVPNENNVIIARRTNGNIYLGIDDQLVLQPNTPRDLLDLPPTSSSLPTKSGEVALGDFTGSPLVAPVVFSTPFANASYSIAIIGEDARSWSVQNKTDSGFEINSNSGTALTANVFWIAIFNGES